MNELNNRIIDHVGGEGDPKISRQMKEASLEEQGFRIRPYTDEITREKVIHQIGRGVAVEIHTNSTITRYNPSREESGYSNTDVDCPDDSWEWWRRVRLYHNEETKTYMKNHKIREIVPWDKPTDFVINLPTMKNFIDTFSHHCPEEAFAFLSAVNGTRVTDDIFIYTDSDCSVLGINTETLTYDILDDYKMLSNLHVWLGPNVDTITECCFSYCENLQSVILGNSVMYIYPGAFKHCDGIKSIVIPDLVNSIQDFTFSGCTSLTSVAFGKSVTDITNGAFMDCSSLKTIDIPTSVTNIGNGAFRDCTSLTSINIPNLDTRFGRSVFDGCLKLTGR
jgi:hypothetical protein